MEISCKLLVLTFGVFFMIHRASSATCTRWTIRSGDQSFVVDSESGMRRRGGTNRNGSFYCMYGCCEGNTDGCCDFGRSRTMIFGALATGVILIAGLCMCFICRAAGRRRQRRANAEVPAVSALSEGPPSYDSCVQDNAAQNSSTSVNMLELGVDNLAFQSGQEGRGSHSKPPSYGDIFKGGEQASALQVAVINNEGQVRFVDWKDVTFTRSSEGVVEKVVVRSDAMEATGAGSSEGEKLEKGEKNTGEKDSSKENHASAGGGGGIFEQSPNTSSVPSSSVFSSPSSISNRATSTAKAASSSSIGSNLPPPLYEAATTSTTPESDHASSSSSHQNIHTRDPTEQMTEVRLTSNDPDEASTGIVSKQ